MSEHEGKQEKVLGGNEDEWSPGVFQEKTRGEVRWGEEEQTLGRDRHRDRKENQDPSKDSIQ